MTPAEASTQGLDWRDTPEADKVRWLTGATYRRRCYSMSRESDGALQTHLNSHGTDVLLLKFRCNIFISIRVINEMPGSAPSETPVRSWTLAYKFCVKYILYFNRHKQDVNTKLWVYERRF
jgi:hypothetical protein